jgi:hypothetical protein
MRIEGDESENRDDEPDPREPEWRFVNGAWVQWQTGDEEYQPERDGI